MKGAFYYCITSLDTEAAKALGVDIPDDTIPEPLCQIDQITVSLLSFATTHSYQLQ